MNLLIKRVYLNRRVQDIYIEDSTIKHVGTVSEEQRRDADTVIDGSDKLGVPTLMNGHTHAGMTLFRGFGDDTPLQEWLEEKIWPLEEQLTEDHVYWASRLACREMIRTGTTFFNDMYWHFEGTRRAVEDSGIRAMISGVFIDQFDEDLGHQQREANQQLYERTRDLPERIQFALGPHSIYTVSPDSLEWIGEFAREHDLPVHIHLSETRWEVEECRENHGTTPVKYLDGLDFLHENVIAAHAIWLTDEDIEILAKRGVSVVYNPLSNLKLTSGDDFQYEKLREAGVPVCLGTDGVASNNNLNLFEEIKMASLIQKNREEDATVLPAGDAVELATENSADIFGLNTGRIEEGALADLMLLDLTHPAMTLADVHDTASHLAYTVTPDAIDTVVCDGEVLIKNGQMKGAGNVRKKVRELTKDLCYKDESK